MAQLGYVTLGTNDLSRAAAFYDALLGDLGARRYIETARGISWSFGPGTTSLSVITPFDGRSASVGNGVMVALGVANRDEVEATYRRAIELGATDEGEPGPRGDAGFYAGYFRDPDGNVERLLHRGCGAERRVADAYGIQALVVNGRILREGGCVGHPSGVRPSGCRSRWYPDPRRAPSWAGSGRPSRCA
jgi:catechol 2,3-dioxygenase-like lactoylglutathione lyase family enzyme